MTDFDRKYLQAVLKDDTVVVTFTKKNGDERVMTCTLQESELPPLVEAKESDVLKNKRKENLEVLSVYDVNAKGWRSFRLDSVKSVTPIEKDT